eukprot:3933154-Rhodomonas_salina.1
MDYTPTVKLREGPGERRERGSEGGVTGEREREYEEGGEKEREREREGCREGCRRGKRRGACTEDRVGTDARRELETLGVRGG